MAVSAKVRERLAARYAKHTRERLEELRTLLPHIRAGEPDACRLLRRMGHSIHGSAASYGFDELGRVAQEVEHASDDALVSGAIALERALVLALGDEPPPAAAAPSEPAPAPRRKRKEGEKPLILAVDDEQDMRTLLSLVFRGAAYELALARSGKECLERVAQGDIDLVVVDALMPGMDGFEVVERLKQDEATRGLPVLLLTGLEDEELTQRAFALGVDDFMQKPFRPRKLLETVGRLLSEAEG